MLDGILGRGFSAKCKSLIKLTKTRIDVIRRKRNATQKFLKKDVADLLSNGLDINAYGRAEGLLVEVILSSCYDFVEGCCDLVLKHLSTMQKQRECPEECRAAVASLMFAAARFSDLPELRDLRQMFYERYGSSLDLFRNEEFVENLASKPSTLENKVRLMKEIALEFSIKWDSKAFEQRMNKPSVSPKDPPKAHGPFHLGGGESNLKADKPGLLFNERFDLNDGHKLNGKDGFVSKMDAVGFQTRPFGNGYNSHNGWKEPIVKRDHHDNLLQERRELGPDRQVALNLKEDTTPTTIRSGSSSHRKRLEPVDAAYKLHYGKEKNIPITDNQDTSLDAKPDMSSPYMKSNGKEKFADRNLGDQPSTASHARKDEVIPKSKPYYNNAIPPPYVKRNDKARSRKHVVHLGSSEDGFDGNGVPKDSTHDRANAGHIPVVQRGSDHPDYERHLGGTERVNLRDLEKDRIYPDDVTGNPIPKPRSSRRRHSKTRSDDGFEGNGVHKDSTHDRTNAGHIPVVQRGSDYSDHERHLGGPERVNLHELEKDRIYPDDVTGNPIPKPRSSRRRHSKSRSGQSDAGNFEDAGALPRKSRSKRRDDSRRGLQLLFDDEHRRTDEEERIIDKLLIHYSKKPAAHDPGKSRKKSSRSRHAHHTDVGESPRNGSRDGSDKESQITPPPARSVSLPHDHSGPSAAAKVFTRAASFQPERSDGARHVHPKLPDYDDLAARFTALRGR